MSLLRGQPNIIRQFNAVLGPLDRAKGRECERQLSSSGKTLAKSQNTWKIYDYQLDK